MSQRTPGKFQAYGDLPKERYDALKEGIRNSGVRVAIELDQHGQVIDGHNRIKAWTELKEEGVKLADYPCMIRHYDDDKDRRLAANEFNNQRRDVTEDQRKHNARALLKDKFSLRKIAEAIGVSEITIRRWLPEDDPCSTATSDVAVEQEKTTGLDGRQRPTSNQHPDELRERARALSSAGSTYREIAESLGVSIGSVSGWVKPKTTVSANNAKDRERALASMEALFAESEDDDPDESTDTETGETISTSQSRQKAAQKERERRNEEIAQNSDMPMPNGKYRCIVIDPPWPMVKIKRDLFPDQGESLDYPVMPVEDIAALPIGDIADDDAHIYLWVTQKFLPDGMKMLKDWGFNYQCVMTWVKPSGFTPFSWMYNTEHVLFGRRGSLDLMRKGLKLSFEAPNPKHSKKPDVFYDRVTEATPGPRIELFAREPREGFMVWGNESGEVQGDDDEV